MSAGSVRGLSVVLLCACVFGSARGQSLTTASRAGDLQVGVGYGVANADYGDYHLKGYTLYSSFDFSRHYGVEVDFHQLSQPNTQLYERSYEAGGRYIPKQFGSLTPYARLMYGRGVLNEPHGYFNIAYNMFVAGGGLEYEVKPWLKVRGDFEYQDWLKGPGLPNGLSPLVGTVGVAYRFGSGRPQGLQWPTPKAAPAPKRSAAESVPPKG